MNSQTNLNLNSNEAEKRTKKVKRSRRRSVGNMRVQMKEELNGFFLEFKLDRQCTDKAKHEWSMIQEKGFQVYSSGCIVPHPYYIAHGSKGPARVRGPKAAVCALKPPVEGFTPPGKTKRKRKKLKKTKVEIEAEAEAEAEAEKKKVENPRNEDGWPTTLEVSHLCHWKSCIRPDHLVVEPRWKNWRRLYCSGCDCPVSFQNRCLRKFHPSAWWEDPRNASRLPQQQLTNIEDVRQILATTAGAVWLSKCQDAMRQEDVKKRNKRKRKRKGKQHAHERARKLRRQQSI